MALNRFWTRRITYGAVAFFVTLCLLRVIHVRTQRLEATSFFSGYVLFGCVLFLMSFNLRKKLPFLPLGSASVWLQLHLYVAMGAMILFFSHTGWRWPNGRFESALYAVFLMTSASGVIGLYLTRTIPRRLTKLREQIIYERIPVLRRKLQDSAHAVVTDLVKQSPAEAIAEFYLSRLVSYFGLPRSVAYYAAPSSQLRNELQQELSALTRFLSSEEEAAQGKLRELIDRRDDLDYHQAQQRRLKLWLFVHLGLTAVLVCLMVVHLGMVHAFSGRAL